jgi:hypothetical protein
MPIWRELPRVHGLLQVQQEPVPVRAGKIPDGAEGGGVRFEEVSPVNACAGSAAVDGTSLLATTAADRLFNDFVILAFIGVAIAIALYIISAFRKLVRRLE